MYIIVWVILYFYLKPGVENISYKIIIDILVAY